MAQKTTGWRRIFSAPAAYRLAQQGIGSPRAKETLMNVYLKPQTGDRVLDIGCGTGELAGRFTDVDYVGHDPSAEYIAAAQERFGDSAEFHVGGVGEVAVESASFDICVAKGVLHHLDDDLAVELFEEAAAALRPGGRLITMDPVFDNDQSRVARLLAERDRGQNVRSADGYAELARSTFDDVTATVHHDLLRVPYSHAFLVCTR